MILLFLSKAHQANIWQHEAGVDGMSQAKQRDYTKAGGIGRSTARQPGDIGLKALSEETFLGKALLRPMRMIPWLPVEAALLSHKNPTKRVQEPLVPGSGLNKQAVFVLSPKRGTAPDSPGLPSTVSCLLTTITMDSIPIHLREAEEKTQTGRLQGEMPRASTGRIV